METLRIYDRQGGKTTEEKIYGEAGMRFLYENFFGRTLESTFLSHAWFSKLYGAYQNSGLSSGKIPQFIQDFKIPMGDYEPGPFASFNDFFIRKFVSGKRSFETAANRFSAPAEGRYLAFPRIDAATPLPVKGATLNGPALLGSSPEMRRFDGGPGFIARLCPVDYHRFHFPDSGKIVSEKRIAGPLHSVNPVALAVRGDLLFRNERVVTVLETENFGAIAYVEVGAICVGKIVQNYGGRARFERGEEKGYFLFGGSTVIVIGEPGKFTMDPDLVASSREGTECLIRLGEGIATGAKRL